MDPCNLLVAEILLAKFSDFILSLSASISPGHIWDYDIAHCENRAINGHVTTLCNLIGRSYALPGDKRKCLHSPDSFSLFALGGAGPQD